MCLCACINARVCDTQKSRAKQKNWRNKCLFDVTISPYFINWNIFISFVEANEHKPSAARPNLKGGVQVYLYRILARFFLLAPVCASVCVFLGSWMSYFFLVFDVTIPSRCRRRSLPLLLQLIQLLFVVFFHSSLTTSLFGCWRARDIKPKPPCRMTMKTMRVGEVGGR